jgi:NAD(P)H-flavin reductase
LDYKTDDGAKIHERKILNKKANGKEIWGKGPLGSRFWLCSGGVLGMF